MTRRTSIDEHRMRSQHEQQLIAEASEFHGRSSGASVELCLVDPGDGDVHVIMTCVVSPTVTRRESCSLDAHHLANWLRTKLTTHCGPPRKGAM